jgi:hypothetical protein
MPISRPTPGAEAAAEAEAAEALALAAIQFLALEAARLQRFIDLTGLGPDDLRARLAEPVFLAGVLDHLLGDEPLLLDFASWAEIAPKDVADARRRLAGHDDPAD